ncbi:SOS response-associated peptidase family protein [Aliikangiella maris]|uniref:Abasic site processing protein n=2 Tax=Aliikangiella maris TaxID=3162458 RepID=A0ABV3MIW9_9GAMM
MCGAIGRVFDNPFVESLLKTLNIDFHLINEYDIRPTMTVPIAIMSNEQVTGVQASWWLFQSATANGYTYNKNYKSFNTRQEKLLTNRKQDFQTQRCIIPASCFYEWNNHRYKIEPLDTAIAFGGLYKTWPITQATPKQLDLLSDMANNEVSFSHQTSLFNESANKNSNEKTSALHYSCSIITLPSIAEFSHIHAKSFPLMLTEDEITPWLDSSFSDINYWQSTLTPKIRFDLKVTPVDRKRPEVAIGESTIIKATH